MYWNFLIYYDTEKSFCGFFYNSHQFRIYTYICIQISTNIQDQKIKTYPIEPVVEDPMFKKQESCR